jgi:hypothetical protein
VGEVALLCGCAWNLLVGLNGSREPWPKLVPAMARLPGQLPQQLGSCDCYYCITLTKRVMAECNGCTWPPTDVKHT